MSWLTTFWGRGRIILHREIQTMWQHVSISINCHSRILVQRHVFCETPNHYSLEGHREWRGAVGVPRHTDGSHQSAVFHFNFSFLGFCWSCLSGDFLLSFHGIISTLKEGRKWEMLWWHWMSGGTYICFMNIQSNFTLLCPWILAIFHRFF